MRIDNPPGPDTPGGPYPTIVQSERTGNTVLIVQASAYTKYLGNITVYYDSDGEVVDYSGAPIFLDNDLPFGNFLSPVKMVITNCYYLFRR